MKTLSLLLGSALLLAPALASAQEAPPAPVVAAPAPVYFAPAWAPAAPGAGVAPEYLVPTRRRSTGLLVGGLVIAGLGTASLIGGAALLVQAADEASCASGGFCKLGADIDREGGTFLAVNGGLMILGGAAMAIAGGWQVPVSPRASGSASSAPTVAVGLGNATLRWSF